jgi:hypothetical protein
MDKLAIFMNGSNMSISPFGTFSFALTVVSCYSTMSHLKGSCSCTIESDLVLHYHIPAGFAPSGTGQTAPIIPCEAAAHGV